MSDNEVAAIRAVTQFSPDYIRKAIAHFDSEKTNVPSAIGYADYKKITLALQAYRLGRRDSANE